MSGSVSEGVRVAHVCYSDARGGAAIGARRMHQAMCSQNVDSRLVVIDKFSDDPGVIEVGRSRLQEIARDRLQKHLLRTHRTGNPVLRSLNLFPSGMGAMLNRLDVDVVHMHWVNADTLSIGEIANLAKPLVWKLPDMWAFSGAEHYVLPDDPERFAEGYHPHNRPAHESGLDLNRLLWRYKRYRWRERQFTIVGPSRWISECARRSAMFRDARVYNIANPLDLELYRPLSKVSCRERFALPHDRKLILFGALNATIDRRKGFHHLQAMLELLPRYVSPDEADVAVLGSATSPGERVGPYRAHHLGKHEDEQTLVEAYGTADVFVLPAELDNLPNVVKEATACGVPCVGFDIGGMPDMVEHGVTGALAPPFDHESLAQGVGWVLDQDGAALSSRVRDRAVSLHDRKRCVDRYLEVYREAIDDFHRGER
ncbi:MAG: glycosyltransferase [Gammaproteobacteria bacterium]